MPGITTREIYEAVSRGKREWEQTFDAVPDLIFITDSNHTITRANRAMARRCGLRPEELPGRKCYEVFHHLTSPPPFCPHVRLLEQGRQQSEEIEEKNLAGVFDVTVSPLYDQQGNIASSVHVARDITDRKKAEEERLLLEHQLQQSQKWESLGVLAGGIAHDFNNILMIILGHCALAVEEVSPESSRGHLKQIEEAALRAADLCRQMLTYAGKTPLVQTRFDLRRLLREMMVMLRPAFKKNVAFELELKNEVAEIIGDQAKVQQIIMNLTVNAVEAIGENNGTVTVALSRREVTPGEEVTDFFGEAIAAGSYACLVVSDTGCGMDQETQRRIFEPFFTTKFTGRGLGMSALLGIIKSHKGALQLSSRPGAGSSFRVFFPIPAPEEGGGMPGQGDAADPAGRTGRTGMRGTVLVVDDEEELRRIASDMLATMGLAAVTASNGQEAVEMFRSGGSDIDLVLTDLAMPELDGIRTYRELRSSDRYLPIVICSGYGNEEVAATIKDDSHAGFLHKPYRAEAMRDLLQGLLAAAEKRGRQK